MDTRVIELSGKERQEALMRVDALFREWGLTLPNVAACPLHFGLNNFNETGEIEYDIHNSTEDGYCGKFIVIFQGQTCPMHYHAVKHETFFLIKGSIELEADSGTERMEQGDIRVMPQYTKHRFTGIEDSLILECSTPDMIHDSIFEDKKIRSIFSQFA